MGYGPLNTPCTAGSNCKAVLPVSVSNLNRIRIHQFPDLNYSTPKHKSLINFHLWYLSMHYEQLCTSLTICTTAYAPLDFLLSHNSWHICIYEESGAISYEQNHIYNLLLNLNARAQRHLDSTELVGRHSCGGCKTTSAFLQLLAITGLYISCAPLVFSKILV